MGRLRPRRSTLRVLGALAFSATLLATLTAGSAGGHSSVPAPPSSELEQAADAPRSGRPLPSPTVAARGASVGTARTAGTAASEASVTPAPGPTSGAQLARAAERGGSLPRPAEGPESLRADAGTRPRLAALLPGGSRPESDARGQRYAGWAMVAYPSLSANEMDRLVARQAAAGANVVWIGHNNPGEVDARGKEPGLSYAVYAAFENPTDPRHADARAIVAAQERLLRAVQARGLKAVLSVGYQSQMGSRWDADHPGALRRDGDGAVIHTTTVTNASFYAAEYRRDIRRYYEWVRDRFVLPYRDAILMVNLADEPSGGDYSPWAEAAFFDRTGLTFARAADSSFGVTQLGVFQSTYLADYAAWSAQQWAELVPDLPTTMSFCGGIARLHLHLPHVEALFARTPPTFYPTFDAYPRDGPPEAAIDDETLTQLFTLVRTLGHYSARYQRPFWLWSSANSWGLAQGSSDPGHVADAVANAYYLALLARQTGGLLDGIAVWNYNVQGQGLYNDARPTRYDPDEMFAEVSASLPRVRQLLAAPAGSAQVLVVAPHELAYQWLGTTRSVDPFELRTYSFQYLGAFARNNVPAAVVGSLAGEDLSRVRGIVLLHRDQQALPELEARILRGYLDQRRGSVLASRALLQRLDLLGAEGVFPLDADPPESAFHYPPFAERAALWRRALDLEQPVDGAYLVATNDDALVYNPGEVVYVRASLPFAGRGWLVDPTGAPKQELTTDGRRLAVTLPKHQLAYLAR